MFESHGVYNVVVVLIILIDFLWVARWHFILGQVYLYTKAVDNTKRVFSAYSEHYISTFFYRNSVANVSTTHVDRAVIAVALVTTSKPGWQEPFTLDISVRVRNTCTHANYRLQLNTSTATIVATNPCHWAGTTYEPWVQMNLVYIANQSH